MSTSPTPTPLSLSPGVLFIYPHSLDCQLKSKFGDSGWAKPAELIQEGRALEVVLCPQVTTGLFVFFSFC